MRGILQKAAPWFVFSGVDSLCFGLLVFFWSGISLPVLIWLFAVSVIIQGILYVLAARRNRNVIHKSSLLLSIGVVSIAGGLFAIFFPGITSLILVKIMGATWLATGVLQITLALRLRKEIPNENWLFLAGIISFLAGLFLLSRPQSDAFSNLWLVIVYAILFGIIIIGFAHTTKRWWRYFDEDVFQ